MVGFLVVVQEKDIWHNNKVKRLIIQILKNMGKPESSIGIDVVSVLSQETLSPIPGKYRGLPSEVVEELWSKRAFVDKEKTAAEDQRRRLALEALKNDETTREAVKQQRLTEKYAKLSSEEKKEFPAAQIEAGKILNEYIREEKAAVGLLPEEFFVLNKLKSAYREFKERNPQAPFAFNFSRVNDQEVFNNLVQRLAFKVLSDRRKISEQKRIEDIRTELGISQQEVQEQESSQLTENELSIETGNEAALAKLEELLAERIKKSKKPQLYRDLFERIKQENNRTKIAETLVNEINYRKRQADYPINPDYQKVWELATRDQTVNHRQEDVWIYRGRLSEKGRSTITRGSLNITLTENTIRELDALIQSGVFDGNYKLGELGTPGEASARHDAVTLYFLSEPSSETLEALSDIAKKYYRGDDLIGRKVSEGFYMSEVGSVSDVHARELIQQLQIIDQELAVAIKNFLTSNKTGKERIAMSEAQFYSAKEMLNLFGFDIIYNKDTGFKILKTV